MRRARALGGALPLGLGGEAGTRPARANASASYQQTCCTGSSSGRSSRRPNRFRDHAPSPSRCQNCGATSAAFAAPCPSFVGPVARVVVPAVVDELEVRAVAHRCGVDAERLDRRRVRRPLVVVRPRLGARAHGERAAVDEHVVRERRRAGRCSRRGAAVGIGMREVVHELQGREQGLVVLVLVLDDHAVDEAVGEQRRVGDRARSPSSTSSARLRTSASNARAPAGSRIGRASRSRRGCLNAS